MYKRQVQEKEEDDVFKIRPTEFKSKINVVGQIDLAALNQSCLLYTSRKIRNQLC